MKCQVSRQVVGLLGLLLPSVSMAFSVIVVPSTVTPNPGQQFTLTLQADVGNSLAATMQVFYDDTKVQWVSGAMPTTGPFAPAAGGSYTKNTPYASGSVFDISTNTATSANPSVYEAVILTFNALAPGAANIVVNDDGGGCCLWADATTAEYIPVTYNQAISVAPVPVPTAAWFISPAVALLAPWVKRKKAASLSSHASTPLP